MSEGVVTILFLLDRPKTLRLKRRVFPHVVHTPPGVCHPPCMP